MARDWYSPREVQFTIRTALWLIQNLGGLRDGQWPAEASNYIDILGKKSGRHKAPFVTPAEYAAEIELRLEKCGIDGLILEAIESWGKTMESMASYFKMPEWSVKKRARRALAYVASGPNFRWHDTKKRKGESYEQFKSTWGKKK